MARPVGAGHQFFIRRACSQLISPLLQKNVLNRRRWTSFEQLRLAIVTWIEGTYHRRRRQARLGRLTPVEFEMVQSTQAATAA